MDCARTHTGLFRWLAAGAAACAGCAAQTAWAQLEPLKPLGTSQQRSLPVMAGEQDRGTAAIDPEFVGPPASAKREGKPGTGVGVVREREEARTQIRLYDGQGKLKQTRACPRGPADLGRLFPELWDAPSAGVVYAQWVVEGKGVGAPVVLTPMLPVRYAARTDREGVPMVPPASTGAIAPAQPGSANATLAGYWMDVDKLAVVSTTRGELTFVMRPDAAPFGVRHFRMLADAGFYNGVPVHRIASLSGEAQADIVQFGDPLGTGVGSPGFWIDFEASPIKHDFGVMSWARASDPNSAGSQVIIDLNRAGTAQLDGRYSAFAQLVDGADTLVAIGKTPVNPDGRPREELTVKSVRLVDGPPMDARPKVAVDPFRSRAER